MARIFSDRFKELLIDSLSNSLNDRMCNKLGERLEPLFNIHKISGISEKITMQPRIMAKNFVDYFFSKNQEFALVNEFIKVSNYGIDGYSINVYNINVLLKELEKLGYIFDKTHKQLVLIDHKSILPDWGILEENKEYSVCLISVDIVKNSKIVREDNPRLIKETFKSFYNFINAKITHRGGRTWIWEGDGGIAAFYGDDAVNRAVFSVLDFYLSMPVFNAVFNKIQTSIVPRIAVHFGKVLFKKDVYSIKSDAIDTVKKIEKNFTQAGEFLLTNVVHISLNTNLKNLFIPVNKDFKHELLKFNFKVGRKPDNG